MTDGWTDVQNCRIESRICFKPYPKNDPLEPQKYHMPINAETP